MYADPAMVFKCLINTMEDLKMSYYLAGTMHVTDPSWQAEYGAKMPDLLARHRGKVLVSAAPDHFEGTALIPSRLVVLCFENKTDAQAWYNDPDNQKLIQLRQSGSTFELLGAG
jgi:uncharacterized protein (DUF1330 family)